jgi:SAM-dependent methyltransferase
MIGRVSDNGSHICVPDGAIPGTQPDFVIKAGSGMVFSYDEFTKGVIPQIKQRWYTQDTYNNQFNLYKYKRLKMFLGLADIVPELYRCGIDEVGSLLKGDRVFRHLISYFEEGTLTELDSCPHCKGDIQPLPPRMSQPFCGYLTPERPYYFECQKCGLISLSPVLPSESIASIYDEFDKEDFVRSLNDPYRSESARCDFSDIIKSLPQGATRCLDLGGGIGKFSQFLKQQYPHWDVTHSDFEIKVDPDLADLGIRSRALNMITEEIGTYEYDLITAWEVVEHIPFTLFHHLIAKIHKALKHKGFFIFSTPDFDSPLCQAYDFYNACPPFHYTVFGTKWLCDYFSKETAWELLAPRYNSDFLDDAEMWYDYAAKTSPSFQLRSLSHVLKTIFTTEYGNALKRHLLSKGWGTEVIITLRKK